VTENGATDEFGWADITVVDGRRLLRLSGEISTEMRPRLDQVLDELGTETRPVDVDLGAVTFLDSSGIGFLARLGIENGAEVRVQNATGLTRDLLSLSGLQKVLTIPDA
jgi:anti-sigma B factor antagonist